jgi:hypothetical protein
MSTMLFNILIVSTFEGLEKASMVPLLCIGCRVDYDLWADQTASRRVVLSLVEESVWWCFIRTAFSCVVSEQGRWGAFEPVALNHVVDAFILSIV